MIYAILILSALFSFYYIGNDFFQEQKLITQTEEIAYLIDSASASKYGANISIYLDDIDLLIVDSNSDYNYVFLKKGKFNYSTVIDEDVSGIELNNLKGVSILNNGGIQVIKWE